MSIRKLTPEQRVSVLLKLEEAGFKVGDPKIPYSGLVGSRIEPLYVNCDILGELPYRNQEPSSP